MKYYWHGSALLDEIKGSSNVEKLRIASAYFSTFGLQLLEEIVEKNKLQKENVELYLSPLFSYKNPSALLKKANELATIYLVESIPFHAKVYWMKDESGNERVIFGSSNFTQGGISRNIEFDMIKDIEEKETQKFDMFFSFCRNNSTNVNEKIIETYKNNESELEELLLLESQMKKKMLAHTQADDPYGESDYDLKGFYFQFQDYELFFMRNQKRKDSTIMSQREELREKLMHIHDTIYTSEFKREFGIFCHKRKDNICSLIMPCSFNHDKVGWLGVRYGKSPAEVDYLNKGVGNKNDKFKFHKHACLQFSINQYGFEVNLFHAVATGAFDRSYVHEQIDKEPNFKDELIDQIENLKGEDFVWVIADSQSNQFFEFPINERDSSDFIEFYKEHDKEGRESFLTYVYKANDIRIKSVQSIRENILYKMDQLLALYYLMTFRVPHLYLKMIE
ncbi:phospholipase D family protein [Brevibacillus sp. NPDC058079]|uniref:phospholipase D family protein n=1 Tax=Brevibacillus sp. NPDC058079 TaxID=3346330 RepID=UPI0036EC3657